MKTFSFTTGQRKSNHHIFVVALLVVVLFSFLINPASATISETSSSSGVVLAMIGIAYLIGMFGYFGKNEWVSILGGLALITVGGYMLINGVDQYKTVLTTYGGIFTLAIGLLFTIQPAVELIEENL